MTQQPGNLPPGATLDSFLTMEEWATWTHKHPRTAERYLRDMKRKGCVLGNTRGQKPLIHVRTYLSTISSQFRKALE